MGQIKICDKCKRSISEREILEGLATEKDGRWTCRACSGGKVFKDAFQQDLAAMLEEIKNEIRAVLRAVSYKESSVWTIFGAVAQVFVFAGIAMSVLTWDKPQSGKFLLVTLICQAMAMTFFLLGK
jgi:hypothetical protein